MECDTYHLHRQLLSLNEMKSMKYLFGHSILIKDNTTSQYTHS